MSAVKLCAGEVWEGDKAMAAGAGGQLVGLGRRRGGEKPGGGEGAGEGGREGGAEGFVKMAIVMP